jgi:hypothetical protein
MVFLGCSCAPDVSANADTTISTWMTLRTSIGFSLHHMTGSESQFRFYFENGNDCIPTWPVRDIDGFFPLQVFSVLGEQNSTLRRLLESVIYTVSQPGTRLRAGAGRDRSFEVSHVTA